MLTCGDAYSGRGMRALVCCLILLSAWCSGAAAKPGTLDRIRAQGVVHCGSAIRPGLAFPGEDHAWYGLNVDFCRAVAAAVLGDPGKVEFDGYALRPDFDRIRLGADDVGFLTATELFTNELFGAVLPGPAVFHETVQVMVWETSPVQHVAELGETKICGEPGTAPDNALHTYAAAEHWQANMTGWMELEEMMDAFNVGRCPAVVGEATALAALRIGSAQEGHPSRLLPEPLAAYPVLVTTPADDPAWAIVVGWVVNTVLAGSGPQTLTIPGSYLGLDQGWQARVLAVGPYTELHRRALGGESALGLPAGVNGSWRDGGVFVPPSID